MNLLHYYYLHYILIFLFIGYLLVKVTSRNHFINLLIFGQQVMQYNIIILFIINYALQ